MCAVEKGSLPPPTIFSWSPSKLSCFETCPNKYAGEYVYRITPRRDTQATIWGNRVHTTAEQYFKREEITDLEAFEPVKPYCQVLDRVSGTKYAELAVGYDADWRITNGWDRAVGRMRLDLVIAPLNSQKMILVDWKTGGTVKSDFTQLEINALRMADEYEGVEEFDLKYIWVKPREVTQKVVNREELKRIRTDIMCRIARMKEAHEAENFPLRKNGLCRDWCGHPRCPHSGRRTI